MCLEYQLHSAFLCCTLIEFNSFLFFFWLILGGLKSFNTPKTTGVIPSPKRYHSSVLAQNKIVMFGGEDEKCEGSDEVIVLNGKTLAWAKPRIVGEKPIPRSRHSCVIYQQDKMICFGGLTVSGPTDEVYVFDVGNSSRFPFSKCDLGFGFLCFTGQNRWEKKATQGTGPSPRYHHIAEISGSNMVVFGGTNGSTIFNDIFILDCS